jgi:ATP-binding cassette subfamily C (CFTR/MRP) protein 10
MVALVFVSLFLMQATRNGSDAWLSYWVDSTATTSRTRDVFFYLVRKFVPESDFLLQL